MKRLTGKQRRKNRGWIILAVIILASCLNFNAATTLATKKEFDGQNYQNNALVENFTQSLQEIGQYRERYGYPIDIKIQGELAFMACEMGGLLIFNVSDPTEPKLVGTFDEERDVSYKNDWSSNLAPSIKVQGELVILGDGYNGLLFINISNPKKPVLLGKHQAVVGGFAIAGNYVYVIVQGSARYNKGNVFRIIDFSDPTKPVVTAEINRTQTGGFYTSPIFSKGYVFSALLGRKVVTINVSDPYNPLEVASVNITGSRLMATKNDFLFLYKFRIGENATIEIINISNPLVPEHITTYETAYSGLENDIAFYDFKVFIGAHSSQSKIIVLNISDIKNITTISELKSPLDIRMSIASITLSIEQQILYVVDLNNGLQCIDVSNITQLKIVGFFDTNGLATCLDIEGEYAYLCSRRREFYPYYHSRLEIISIANLSKPVLVGRYEFWDDFISDIEVVEGIAYLSMGYKGLYILNVSDPANPTLLGVYTNDPQYGFFQRLWVDNEHKRCYLTHDYYDLLIIDCADPTNPELYCTILISEPDFILTNVVIQGDIAYLSSSLAGILLIADISNPFNPVALSWTYFGTWNYISDFFVRGNLIYVTTRNNLIAILDASNKNDPKFFKILNNHWAFGQEIVADGNYAYIAQYAGGLRVVDVTNPSEPKEVAAVRDHYRGLCFDVFVREDGTIFIADGWDGLEVYRLVEEEATTILLYSTLFLLPATSFLAVDFIVLIHMLKKKNK
ncbi:MAG: hypothetical protein DRP02_00680 [Candidatus Gerdarchaeota archaeon]|nr:MAG: hypothetical protein DRP02_00680 [Candidatus Gerdarchaeota archaeon]